MYKLNVLYSKYGSSTDKVTRPLGLIRNVTEKQRSYDSAPGRTDEAVQHPSTVSGEDTVRERIIPKLMEFGRNHIDTKNVVRPKADRSKTQVFQSRYKLASLRPETEIKTNRYFSRRVIQLPMFRISVDTFLGDMEETRVVESTRQSLQKMIERGKKRPPNNTVASIKNYKFINPMEVEQSLSTQVKSLNDTNDISQKSNYTIIDSTSNITRNFFTYRKSVSPDAMSDKDRMDIKIEPLSSERTFQSLPSSGRRSTDDDDFSTVSTTGRSSHLTLKSTLSEIDHVTRANSQASHISDRSISLADKFHEKDNKPNPTWYDTIEQWRLTAEKQRTGSAIGTGNAKWPSNPKVKRQNVAFNPTGNVQKSQQKIRPVFRYTSNPCDRLNNVIIVPSHTDVHCPLCKLCFAGEDSTICPPNSPVSDISLVYNINSQSTEEYVDHDTHPHNTRVEKLNNVTFHDKKMLNNVS